MKSTFLILLLPLLSWSAIGQTEHKEDYASGLIMDDADYEGQPREPKFSGTKYIDLPGKVDLKPYCPAVAFQGKIESCVGWAVGYGALTIQRAIRDGIKNRGAITQNASSALFVYNQIKQNDDCRSGAKISDAVKFVSNNGDCLSQNFDGNINDCSRIPDAGLQEEASQFAPSDFMTLFAANEESEIKSLKVQKALANNQPVIIGLKILKNFYHAKGVNYWRPEIGNQTYVGGHAVVVVGYDEFKGAFQIMNSWGKEWGKGGFIWIKYKDFGEYCKYAYVLHLGEKGISPTAITVNSSSATNNNRPVNTSPSTTKRAQKVTYNSQPTDSPNRIAGSFVFKYLDNSNEEEDPSLKSAAVHYNGINYKIDRTDWQIGQFFQLVTTSASQNDYIYVFSVDMEGEVNIHWPRQEGLNNRFVGINESALVTTAGSEIYIPGKNKGLKLEKKGIEHLCILFSTKKIGNIKAVSEYMQDKKGDFSGNLEALLSDYLVPKEAIQFADNRIEFTTNSEQGFIVPIVVELEAR